MTYSVFPYKVVIMIKSYGNKETEEFAAGEKVKQFEAFRPQAERRLEILDAATSIQDLAALPSNRFKALKGNREAEYSIRINRQWRICFQWLRGVDGPEGVKIEDYH